MPKHTCSQSAVRGVSMRDGGGSCCLFVNLETEISRSWCLDPLGLGCVLMISNFKGDSLKSFTARLSVHLINVSQYRHI